MKYKIVKCNCGKTMAPISIYDADARKLQKMIVCTACKIEQLDPNY